MSKEGIETHRWGYYMKADDKKLIATCIAKTLYEAEEELKTQESRRLGWPSNNY